MSFNDYTSAPCCDLSMRKRALELAAQANAAVAAGLVAVHRVSACDIQDSAKIFDDRRLALARKASRASQKIRG